jgi:hypothetical protein
MKESAAAAQEKHGGRERCSFGDPQGLTRPQMTNDE